jgi:glutathione S-transferase
MCRYVQSVCDKVIHSALTFSLKMLKLIGLLDSPFVRRVAITANLYGIAFERLPWSVYRNAYQLREVNPLMTVPTLVLDDGSCLIDSNFICEYLDELAPEKAITLTHSSGRMHLKQIVAKANVTCEKVGQLYRELPWRPEGLRYSEAIDRFRVQIDAGLAALEQSLVNQWYLDDRCTHADVMAAITYTFVHYYSDPLQLKLKPHPKLAALTQRLEATESFLSTPLE